MDAVTALDSANILAAYDFSRFHSIVDVGGGNGAFIAQVLSHYPNLSEQLADLPHVVSLATSVLQRAGVSNRCEVVECNFFEAVPSGGDV